MDLATFLPALLAIILIDLVLAGDNAIVIALAARNLPEPLKRRAILWGAIGAIAVRSVMTLAVVWLLKIPGLMLAGGAALVWIAVKLLQPQEAETAHGAAATSFWAAMRTIVVADALMGLDNVLAVAGAAHGNYLLVVLGLLISVPIVMGGSHLVLRLVDRFPMVIYIGAAVLAWTAAKMMHGEPVLQAVWASQPLLGGLPYLAIPLVLGAGALMNHRRRDAQIQARLAAQEPGPAQERAAQTGPNRETTMVNVLVPVDGTPNGLRAVQHAIRDHQRGALQTAPAGGLQVHLLHVQPRLSRHIARFLPRRRRDEFYREQSDRALQPAQAALAAAQVPHAVHRAFSADPARQIVDQAAALGCDQILIGSARRHSFTRMLQDAVTMRVLQLSPLPVALVNGEAVSRLERYGIPACIGVGLGLMALALD